MAESNMYANVDPEPSAPLEENEASDEGAKDDDLGTAKLTSENDTNALREKLGIAFYLSISSAIIAIIF